MSAARDLVAALVAGGMDPIEASTLLARAAVEMMAVVIRKSPGAKRQEAWRERNKASQSVSPRHEDEASQSVSERLETSQRDAASLSKEESKKKENKKERAVTRASQIPDGWLPDEQVWKAAVDRIGLDRCNAEFTKFKNHAADKGRVSKHWNSAWRNWVDRAIEYGATNGTRNFNTKRGSAGSDFFAGMRGLAADIAGDHQPSGDAAEEIPVGRVNIEH